MRHSLKTGKHFYADEKKYLKTLFCFFFVSFFIAINTHAATCSVQAAPQLVFGAYDPLSAVHHDMSTTLIINCDPEHRRELLRMEIGFIGGENGGTDRIMKGPVDTLRFGLFSNPTRSLLITDTSKFSISAVLIGSQNFFFPIYGRIYARQSVNTGTYYSTLLMTIDF